MIRYEVSSRDVLNAKNKLMKLKDAAPKNLKNAVNRTATKTRRAMTQGMQSAYTFKGGFKVGSLTLIKARPGDLTAKIKSEGPVKGTKEFQYSDSGSGISAAVRKGGGKLVKGREEAGPAFIGKGGPSGFAGHIVQRKTRERYPLRVLHSDSIPKMAEMTYMGKNGGNNLEPEMRRTLIDEMGKEIAKLIGSP